MPEASRTRRTCISKMLGPLTRVGAATAQDSQRHDQGCQRCGEGQERPEVVAPPGSGRNADPARAGR